MAATFGTWLPGRGRTQEARLVARVREEWRRAPLPHPRRQSLDEEQSQIGSSGRLTTMARRSPDPEGLEAEIDRVRSLGLDGLRARWRTTFRSSPPPALTKDLMAREIAWYIQEQALGGPDAAALKLLGSLARGEKPESKRRLKTGTVLVREYQGGRHTVTVVPGGFLWRDTSHRKLSPRSR